jgi:hypothetical protein
MSNPPPGSWGCTVALIWFFILTFGTFLVLTLTGVIPHR